MKSEKDKKWKWPAEKMREWTDDELDTRGREFADQLFRLKFQMAGGQMEHLPTVRELRKGIARVKTIQRERESAAEAPKVESRK
jgi:large subunit ribosomal protein L29